MGTAALEPYTRSSLPPEVAARRAMRQRIRVTDHARMRMRERDIMATNDLVADCVLDAIKAGRVSRVRPTWTSMWEKPFGTTHRKRHAGANDAFYAWDPDERICFVVGLDRERRTTHVKTVLVRWVRQYAGQQQEPIKLRREPLLREAA